MPKLNKIVFATNNAHKLDEIRSIAGESLEVLSLSDIGCHADIPENENTLEGNALAKARYVKEHYGYDCFADDTGLEVEALSGAPGVHSARFAPGTDHDSQANMTYLLSLLEGKENRKARFRTVIALIAGKEETLLDGIVEGEILKSPQGNSGFGYDPVFKPNESDRTFAQMTAEEKNAISHRGRATSKLLKKLKI
ncbi:MAG: non-canonical purine NTP diphosphatase [Bacteroidales bacterium]|nr:non-canonical purine NTP diphosphatase [Bacteroidales bacterium]